MCLGYKKDGEKAGEGEQQLHRGFRKYFEPLIVKTFLKTGAENEPVICSSHSRLA